MQKNKSVFISSTFKDMQSERDTLREFVLPELSEELSKQGLTLDFIDLRWGISTAENEENATVKIIKTCFDEIIRANPYFICFIGDRYGWIPPVGDVAASLADSGGETLDYTNKSITHLEVEFATKILAERSHCFFFFRDGIDFEDEIDDHERQLFFVSKEDKRKADDFKRYIESNFPDRVMHYRAAHRQDTNKLFFEDGFVDTVISKLKTLFSNLNTHAPKDYIEEYDNLFESHTASHLKNFSGREDVIKDLTKLVEDNKILAIAGESGLGKSYTMSKLGEVLAAQGGRVMQICASLTEHTTTIEGSLKLLTVKLFDAAYTEHTDLSKREEILRCQDITELCRLFYFYLHALSERQRVYILLDAVNQLTRSDYQEHLRWLNELALPDNARLVLSMVPECREYLEIESRSLPMYRLPSLSGEEVVNIADKYLARNHKTLSPSIVATLPNKGEESRACTNPLYLSLLLNRIVNLSENDFKEIYKLEREGMGGEQAINTYITEIIGSCPSTIEGLLEVLLNQTASYFNDKGFVERIIDIIALSHGGVSEEHIEGIYNRLQGCAPFAAADFSLLRKLLRGHLIQKESGDWDFAHQRVRRFFEQYANASKHKNEVLNESLTYIQGLPAVARFKRREIVYYLSALNMGDDIRFAFTNAGGELAYQEEQASALRNVVIERINSGKTLEDIFKSQSRKEQFAERIIIPLITGQSIGFEYSEKVLLETIATLCSGDKDILLIAAVYDLLSAEAAKANDKAYAEQTANIARVLRKKSLKKAKKAPKSGADDIISSDSGNHIAENANTSVDKENANKRESADKNADTNADNASQILSLEQAKAAVIASETSDTLKALAAAYVAEAGNSDKPLEYLSNAERIYKRIAYVSGDAADYALYIEVLNKIIALKELPSEEYERVKAALIAAREHERKHFKVIKNRQIIIYERTVKIISILALIGFLTEFSIFSLFGNGLALRLSSDFSYLFYNYAVNYGLMFCTQIFVFLTIYSLYNLLSTTDMFSAKRDYWKGQIVRSGIISAALIVLHTVTVLLINAFDLSYSHLMAASGMPRLLFIDILQGSLWVLTLFIGIIFAAILVFSKPNPRQRLYPILIVFAVLCAALGGFFPSYLREYWTSWLAEFVVAAVACALYLAAAIVWVIRRRAARVKTSKK